MVPGAGIEPARHCCHWCLRPARLPIPPSGLYHACFCYSIVFCFYSKICPSISSGWRNCLPCSLAASPPAGGSPLPSGLYIVLRYCGLAVCENRINFPNLTLLPTVLIRFIGSRILDPDMPGSEPPVYCFIFSTSTFLNSTGCDSDCRAI